MQPGHGCMDRFLHFNCIDYIAEHCERIERNHNRLRRARVFRERGNPLNSLNDGNFFQRFRMTGPRFCELLSYVHDDLEHCTKKKLCSFSIPAATEQDFGFLFVAHFSGLLGIPSRSIKSPCATQ